MIQTLRITGVAAVALAGVVLASVLGPVSLIHLDNQSGQRMEKILTAPSAVERFREQNGDRNQGDLDTTPPLVRQAETFKGIIDPPPPPAPVARPAAAAAAPRAPVVRPPAVTQKFELVGTSHSPSNPAFSFAYIRLPDGTYQWIPSGGQIGHLVVKEIRQGSIICLDGQTESEIQVEPVPDTANLLIVGGGKSASTATAPQPVEVKVTGQTQSPPRLPNRPGFPRTPRPTAQIITDNEQEALGELVSRLKELQNRTGGAPVDANKLSPEYGSSRLSPEEARKLEVLGQKLGGDSDNGLEEAKRELLRRLNAAHTPGN